MTPLLEQFIVEARDFLQSISEKLIALEGEPGSAELMTELFRLVHTLKGNSGLFDFPEMTRVLHAGEDLMDAVRDGRVGYSRELADRLLDAMDFVGALIDEIAVEGRIDAGNIALSEELARALRALIPAPVEATAGAAAADPLPDAADIPLPEIAAIAESARLAAWQAAGEGKPLFLIGYRPDEECFFKGEDPLHQARHVPGLLWGAVVARASWPKIADLDCYRCALDFHLLVAAARAEVDEYFRYTPEQVRIAPLAPLALIVPQGDRDASPVCHDFVGEARALLDAGDADGLDAFAQTLLELSAPDLWLSSALRWLRALLAQPAALADELRPIVLRRLVDALATLTAPDWSDLLAAAAQPAPSAPQAAASAAPVVAAPSLPPPLSAEDRARIAELLAVQAEILDLASSGKMVRGQLDAVAASIRACLLALGDAPEEMNKALADAHAAASVAPLAGWLDAYREDRQLLPEPASESQPGAHGDAVTDVAPAQAAVAVAPGAGEAGKPAVPAAAPAAAGEGTAPGEGEPRFGRRAEDAHAGKILKVDQAKVDRLMNLIGEMVVAKNALPYLANRADNQYGVRDLAREIKAQYAVINRIAEEMQDAIMQVRMMPVSFIFQRFPRLVRDISRKLGKEVELRLEGEDTEADKNIIESLADPLIHIVRNSLDHGIETPEVRQKVGKPAAGLLHIRALQESDHVIIEIVDDGRGIDPLTIKRKAWEKGLIDETQIERLSDQEAINLVFLPGFSTAEAVSDLSGRGVGMDVVRNAIDKVNGTVELSSVPGQGTRLRLSLPLSMAVTNVMIIESDRQIFGVPMDLIVETVRLPRAGIKTIKRQQTAVLRGKIVPLVALNDLLAVPAEPLANGDDELAALVVRVGGEQVGLLVDDFREVVDVILKPLPGELARLRCYAGTALLGDGSVLMVLNPKELF